MLPAALFGSGLTVTACGPKFTMCTLVVIVSLFCSLAEVIYIIPKSLHAARTVAYDFLGAWQTLVGPIRTLAHAVLTACFVSGLIMLGFCDFLGLRSLLPR